MENQMNLESAIECLANAAYDGTGAAAGAATVLLNGWNSEIPIKGLLGLDVQYLPAALIVIEAAAGGRLNDGLLIENIVGGQDIKYFNRKYGIRGSAWL
jgi:hypothetical protein